MCSHIHMLYNACQVRDRTRRVQIKLYKFNIKISVLLNQLLIFIM